MLVLDANAVLLVHRRQPLQLNATFPHDQRVLHVDLHLNHREGCAEQIAEYRFIVPYLNITKRLLEGEEDQLPNSWEASGGQHWLVKSCAGSTGTAPSSNNAHRRPLKDVRHLFFSAFCKLQKDQLPKFREASGGEHWLVKSRAGSTGKAPSSHVSNLDLDVSSLRSLCMDENQGRRHLWINFFQLPEYQPQQAQGATNDNHGCLPYYAFTEGATSSDASYLNLGKHWLPRLPITHLDRGDKCRLFHNILLHLRQVQFVSKYDKNGHHLETTTVEGWVYPMTQLETAAPCVPNSCAWLATLTQLKVICTHTLGNVHILKHLGDDWETARRFAVVPNEFAG
ncbi:hypothetical protein MRX96_005152 [Rhipicephalus microplus]